MFFACGIWCLADVSSVSPSSEQTELITANKITTTEYAALAKTNQSYMSILYINYKISIIKVQRARVT